MKWFVIVINKPGIITHGTVNLMINKYIIFDIRSIFSFSLLYIACDTEFTDPTESIRTNQSLHFPKLNENLLFSTKASSFSIKLRTSGTFQTFNNNPHAQFSNDKDT